MRNADRISSFLLPFRLHSCRYMTSACPSVNSDHVNVSSGLFTVQRAVHVYSDYGFMLCNYGSCICIPNVTKFTCVAIPPLTLYIFMAWCLVKHRDGCSFYLYRLRIISCTGCGRKTGDYKTIINSNILFTKL
jgi:hypothetical protein